MAYYEKSQAKIVPCMTYVSPSGTRYSPFSSYVPAGSKLETKGYTIAWPDGTTGTGRKAFASVEEAEAYLAKLPKNFSGMHALGN